MFTEKLELVHDKRRGRTALGTSWGDAVETLGVSLKTAHLKHQDYPHEVLLLDDEVPMGRMQVTHLCTGMMNVSDPIATAPIMITLNCSDVMRHVDRQYPNTDVILSEDAQAALKSCESAVGVGK